MPLATNSEPSSRPSSPRIDAHHHLWNYAAERFGWIDDSMASLRRDFTVDDLLTAMRSAGVDAAITVQAQETLGETAWLLELAAKHAEICGVVGWAPLEDSALPGHLDALSAHAGFGKLVGCREIVQSQAAGFLDRGDFNRGVACLTERDLAYDILIRRDQLEEATRFADRHPKQRLVLDHLAKPAIARAELQPWRNQLLELARRENVWCKVSGMVTEANWSGWTAADLRPYLDTAVEAFGVDRLLAGSDWPVCLLATSYRRWWEQLADYFAPFSSEERNRIFGLNALNAYRVPSDSLPHFETT